MEKNKTQLKSYIDKLIKSHSQNASLPIKTVEGKTVIDVFKFLEELLKKPTSGYFPESKRDCEALMILSSSHELEKKSTFSYEKSFKYACDINHPSICNIPSMLGISDVETEKLVSLIKNFNGNYLDYFHLFKTTDDGTNLDDFTTTKITKKIDEISINSTHGTIISHPAKMTNPYLKNPKLFFDNSIIKPDGFVRTGNIKVNFDLHINANKLIVFKFLSLMINDLPMLDYIKNKDSFSLARVFNVPEKKAMEWIEKFNQCLTSQNKNTSSHIKQVYFPIGSMYHLLSILSPSGLVFSLKDKIEDLNKRSKHAFLGRKALKKSILYSPGFSTLTNITITKHGGDHPKNISALNNKYQTIYLLDSSPPQLEQRNIHFPRQNFFINAIRFYDIREPLQKLHSIFKTGLDSAIPRQNLEIGRDHRLEEILDKIIIRRSAILTVAAQYRQETCNLPLHQKIWLCNEYQIERIEQQEWLDELCEEISNWIFAAYKKVIRKAVTLGSAEYEYIKAILITNREALR
ncbi:type I-F CRISPR-associated protein Csy1 [Legionella dresdenensis]|uniref:Type I-F CRISPR-associated protein Csy1 n=1 Tax=Legionella dresdenensis TaxID=450200 RepID=A0ABV8CGJ2_9GAMM